MSREYYVVARLCDVISRWSLSLISQHALAFVNNVLLETHNHCFASNVQWIAALLPHRAAYGCIHATDYAEHRTKISATLWISPRSGRPFELESRSGKSGKVRVAWRSQELAPCLTCTSENYTMFWRINEALFLVSLILQWMARLHNIFLEGKSITNGIQILTACLP